MELTITNYRGESYEIKIIACFAELVNAIGLILTDIGICESKSEINNIFLDCKYNFSNFERIEYVLSHLTAKNYCKSNVLSVFIPKWRDWLITKICQDNPSYAVETGSMHRQDFYEELDEIVNNLYNKKVFYPNELKMDDWRFMLIIATE